MEKKTGVLLYPLFSEYEITVALSILKQGKHPITTIGISAGPILGESDLACIPDQTIYDVDIESLDSLLLPGCMDITTLYDRQDVVDFIKRCSDTLKNLVIASISSSPYLLARAGLLENRKYTVGMLESERRITGVFQEDHYSNDLVVLDGNILTARGRGFIPFGVRLGQLLNLEFDPKWYLANE
ncbi:DJ-1/PfpI family protein [Cohnella sp. AR92]|uniref:DJ-1/PfpI family protein n=1 Tax=Cohnella sp. AR92 TaxID=648716 RepID=UPI001EDFCEAE|nr:DJ-1/PfpI family protein [Cohnella sp. AR92]